MPTVIGRALGLGGVVLLLAGAAAGASAAAPDGPRLAFVRWSSEPSKLELLSVDAAGSGLQRIAGGFAGRSKVTTGAPVPFDRPSWSPDGSQIAFSGYAADSDKPSIFVAAADGTSLHVVPGTRGVTSPVFSADGRTLAFSRTRLRTPRIDPKHPLESLGREYESTTTWLLDLTTSSKRRLTPWRNGLDNTPSSFSPDGSTLALSRSGPRGPEAVALHLADGKVSVLARNAEEPVYSPDGMRVAFVSYRDRNLTEGFDEPVLASELYVKPAGGGGLRRLTHTDGLQESAPSWDPSGERLAYTQTTGSEPLAFGFTNVLMQINADGSCSQVVFGRKRTARADGPGLYGPAWQPGPSREAGRIAC